jgi:CheY-like chemotaxis protein
MSLERAPLVNIFVIDDDRLIADTLAMVLRFSGFVATSFTNPLEALHRVQTDVPDLVITDVVMPEMNGIEFGIRTRELCPNCRVLLFSGQPLTAQILSEAHAQGHVFDILAKPVHPKDLLDKLAALHITPARDAP